MYLDAKYACTADAIVRLLNGYPSLPPPYQEIYGTIRSYPELAWFPEKCKNALRTIPESFETLEEFCLKLVKR